MLYLVNDGKLRIWIPCDIARILGMQPNRTDISAMSITLMQSATEVPPVPPLWVSSLRISKHYLNDFLSDSMRSKPFAKRKKHQKSRRGCTTCKQRHIRCDEALPRCLNCIRRRSPCHYPQAHYLATASSAVTVEGQVGTSNGHAGLETNAVKDDHSRAGVPPPAVQPFREGLEIIKIGSRSLEPYPGAAIFMNLTKREQLAVCEYAIGSVISFERSPHLTHSTADTEEILPLILPVPNVRDAWKRTIVPLALAEPMILYSLLSTVARGLPVLRGTPPGECSVMVYSHKVAAISLLNQKLDNISEAPKSTIEAAITTVLFSAGQEVRFSCGLIKCCHQ